MKWTQKKSGRSGIRATRNSPIFLARGGYIGQGHFGGMWTGDDASGWNYMQEELPKALNMGICGFPVTGADVGGFAPDSEDDYNHCQEETIKAKYLNYPLMDFYYLRLRGCHLGEVFDTKGNKYSQVSSPADLYNAKGAAYFHDAEKAEEWIKFSSTPLTKTGDSFQITKQDDSPFSLTPLSFPVTRPCSF